MKFSFQFSNLYGTVYRNGNVAFTPDGNTVISPVGNKISLFHLKNHKSETLPIESRFSYTSLALSPNGVTLVAVGEDGEVHLISLISRTILHRLRTNRNIVSIKFSPDSKHFAMTKENNVFVYKSPGPYTNDYSPFVMERVLKGANDEATCLTWSDCSRIVAVGAKDMTVRIYPIETFKNFTVCTLGGMSDPVVGIFFDLNSLDCYSVSSGGQLSVWESSLDPEALEVGKYVKVKKKPKPDESDEDSEANETEALKPEAASSEVTRLSYKRSARHFINDHIEDKTRRVRLTAADFHKKTKIFVAGFSNGTFLLLSLPDASLIHSLSISEQNIAALSFNSSGDWIVFGCPTLGQLLVWEWQSETYVLKQQGHENGMTSLSYSPDGAIVATGGQDAKVKLWHTSSGFSFVTFSEHESSVTGVCFTPNGKVVLSCSLDGTVRAFDLARYRNFKTFTTPRPVQLSCVSVDSSGDLIVAGGQDVFEIYLWSLTTGRLVDVLSGHEGPVSAVSFSSSPTSSQLASVSWDKTLKIWDALDNNSHREAIELTSEGIAVCWRPDGKMVSVSTLSGQILTFDSKYCSQVSSITGRKDLRMGKGEADKISSKKKSETAHFSTICYSADGSCILAGGTSKYICIYNVEEQMLVKKFEITQNRSFDCMDDTINRRKMTEFGNIALVEDRDDGAQLKLAGTKASDNSSRTVKLDVRVSSLRFSPTGRAFSAVSTEGLLVYSLDRHLVFNPFQLETKITPQSVRTSLKAGQFGDAIIAAFKLNEKALIRETMEQTPVADMSLLINDIPISYLLKILNFIGEEIEDSRHIEFYLTWCRLILLHHGSYIKSSCNEFMPILNLLIKNISRKCEDFGKICDNNKFTMKYLVRMGEMSDVSKPQLDPTDDMLSDKAGDSEQGEDVDMETLVSKWSDDDESE